VKRFLAVAALAAVFAAVPSSARAETIGVRAGLEAPIYTKIASSGFSQSYTIGDTLQPAVNILLTYKPLPVVGFDFEFREGFAHTGSSNQYSRTGTAIGPGLHLSAPGLPLFVRASLPIHVEPSPVVMGLRGAAGLEFSLVLLSIYAEAVVDTSLVGGAVSNAAGTASGPNVGPFDQTVISLGTGVWLKF
jgi:hypothetical protein